MNFLSSVLAFFVALGTLIVFHELGHYWVARLCNVKVLRFSVGMGKVVWSRRFGPDQTEWAVSALPLGGYVKMLDAREQDLGPLSEADAKREFTRQSVWKRIAIVAAGPAANFLLAIVIFAGLYMHGVPEPVSRISVASEDSAAWRAGLRRGDLITAVNGQAVASLSEVHWQIMRSAVANQPATLEVERAGAGRQRIALAADTLKVDGDVFANLGLAASVPPLVQQVLAGSAGERAGLLPGDKVVSVDGRPVGDTVDVISAVRGAPGRALAVGVLRGADTLLLSVMPAAERGEDVGSKGTVTVGKIGVLFARAPDMIEVAWSPGQALSKAPGKVWDTCVMQFKMIRKMIVGEASVKNLTGPLTIADYAGKTARMGPIEFIGFIAFVSVGLGFMNLLPIPVLDGGHLLYYSLEVLTGRPLPERISDIMQRLGVGMLVALMMLAVFNDVARLL